MVDWTSQLVDGIEEKILSGASIASICGSETFPHDESTFWRHFGKDESFASVIARAMEVRSDRDIEFCRQQAMSATADDWQVAQLRIRTFQWEAGKRRPKKYGDKQLHTGADGEGPVEIIKRVITDV